MVHYYTQFNGTLWDNADSNPLGPKMPKQNDDSCLLEDQDVTFFFTYLKQPFIKNNVSQFNTSQKKLEFYEIFAYSISPVNSLKTFYIDIKTIERVKRQTMFQTVPKK